MKRNYKRLLGALSFAVAIASVPATSYAIPSLQLDIAGGTYNNSTQTIVATSDPFTLYGLLIPDSGNRLSDTYYISAALLHNGDPVGSTPQSLGSFTFNGTTVNVTSGMNYGVPPVESASVSQPSDSHDLQTHGIFPTYFKEFSFQFNSANKITAYNTQDRAQDGDPLNTTINPNGTMYFAAFDINTAGLNAGYELHFDLYNKTNNTSGDIDITDKAPFSHDAESGGGTSVPEPGTLLLIGSGLTGMYLTRRLRKG